MLAAAGKGLTVSASQPGETSLTSRDPTNTVIAQSRPVIIDLNLQMNTILASFRSSTLTYHQGINAAPVSVSACSHTDECPSLPEYTRETTRVPQEKFHSASRHVAVPYDVSLLAAHFTRFRSGRWHSAVLVTNFLINCRKRSKIHPLPRLTAAIKRRESFRRRAYAALSSGTRPDGPGTLACQYSRLHHVRTHSTVLVTGCVKSNRRQITW